MRVAWLILLLVGCTSEGLPVGDGGTQDLRQPAGDLARRLVDLAGVDLAGPPTGMMCVSTCNRCAGGGCCGSACCAAGEWCDASFTCRCGNGAACGGTLICASGGPIMMGGSQCGAICCGDSQHPCPL